MNVSGRLLFPGNTTGGKVAAATLYRQVRATFAAAGIKLNREGGRTLRNTFAQRELEAGTTLDELGEYLGLHERRSVERYLESAAFQKRAASSATPA
jgi:integrase/recombinase XerD